MVRIVAHHDLLIVAAATALCVAGLCSALRLLEHARATSGARQGSWIAAAGLAFASCLWVTQYLLLLAVVPPPATRFDTTFVVLAACIALAGAVISFRCAVASSRITTATGAILLGLTMAGANLISNASLFGPATPQDAAAIAGFAISLVLVPLAWLALSQTPFALLLSANIVALHLSLATGHPPRPLRPPANFIPLDWMTVGAAAGGALLLAGSFATAWIDRYLIRRTAAENAQLRRFAEATFEGLFVLEAGRIVEANTALCGMLGTVASEIIGRPAFAFFTDDCHEALSLLQNGRERGLELQMLDASGHSHHVEVLARALTAHPGGRIAVAVREAFRKQAENRIQDLAHTDRLTGLANRFLMQERLAVAIADAEREGSAVAVLSLNLDRLQDINERLGQAAGDTVLAEVAALLRSQVRANDTIARVSAGEFIIIAPLQKDTDSTQYLADRICRTLADPVRIDGQTAEIIAVSVGVALYPAGATSADMLLRQAAMARARARQENRGGYCFFAAATDSETPERRSMEHDLRRAIDNEEFTLHYQPMFNAETLSVVSYEALLRWKRPLGGFVPPGEFIPIAEASGAMLSIGFWALRTACAEAAAWPDRHGVSLNLSLVQLQDSELPTKFVDILADTGLPASRLELEVSERLLIGNPVRVLSTMRALQAQGIRIALDDFGSGTASLRNLQCFPFDRVKIHRSFVIDLGADPNAETIVRDIMGMARDARLAVTAAGVENEHQLGMLRGMRCNHLQGFLLGRPAPASSIVHRAPAHLAAA